MTNNNSAVAIAQADSYRPNKINRALNEIFHSLGMNPDNPFEGLVKPGQRVFIKPNWVASRWRKSCDHIDDLYCVITHPNVIEAVADRVALALQGKGEIIIADNPSIDADFEELMEFTGIRRLEGKYDVPCHIYDLRPLVCKDLKDYGKKDKMAHQPGDPNGEFEVNLGRESLLHDVDSTLFRGVFDEREETVAAHTGDTQLYTISGSLYTADTYISIPKLKTHQKVGATLNLKGQVGAMTRKNQLVHWRVGSPETGGDEYPDRDSWERAQQSNPSRRPSWQRHHLAHGGGPLQKPNDKRAPLLHRHRWHHGWRGTRAILPNIKACKRTPRRTRPPHSRHSCRSLHGLRPTQNKISRIFHQDMEHRPRPTTCLSVRRTA